MKVYDDNANKESKTFKNIISERAAKRFSFWGRSCISRVLNLVTENDLKS